MTFNELLKALLAVCPQGSMEQDNDGQLVFYTDFWMTDDGTLKTLQECTGCFGSGTTGGGPPGSASPCDVCHGSGVEPLAEG